MDVQDLVGPTLANGERETRAVMINTLFGAFGRFGSSGRLGNDLDGELIQALREWADVILVGASTVVIEDYGPADTPMAVLSSSLELEPDLGIFDGAQVLILAPESTFGAEEDAISELEAAGAAFISTGEGTMPEVVGALHARGFNRILCEGGPSVYGDMIGNDLVDVLHLTVDPTMTFSDAPYGLERHYPGKTIAEVQKLRRAEHRFTLEHVAHTGDSMLFCRYRAVR